MNTTPSHLTLPFDSFAPWILTGWSETLARQAQTFAASLADSTGFTAWTEWPWQDLFGLPTDLRMASARQADAYAHVVSILAKASVHACQQEMEQFHAWLAAPPPTSAADVSASLQWWRGQIKQNLMQWRAMVDDYMESGFLAADVLAAAWKETSGLQTAPAAANVAAPGKLTTAATSQPNA